MRIVAPLAYSIRYIPRKGSGETTAFSARDRVRDCEAALELTQRISSFRAGKTLIPHRRNRSKHLPPSNHVAVDHISAEAPVTRDGNLWHASWATDFLLAQNSATRADRQSKTGWTCETSPMRRM